VTGGPTSPRPLRVKPPPIGPGSNPPSLSEGGGRWPTTVATQPGSSHRQSGLDPLDLPPMPRTRSICCRSGLDLCHRLRRWGEGWRRPATTAARHRWGREEAHHRHQMGDGAAITKWGMEQSPPPPLEVERLPLEHRFGPPPLSEVGREEAHSRRSICSGLIDGAWPRSTPSEAALGRRSADLRRGVRWCGYGEAVWRLEMAHGGVEVAQTRIVVEELRGEETRHGINWGQRKRGVHKEIRVVFLSVWRTVDVSYDIFCRLCPG
jgi:hypothetical protein